MRDEAIARVAALDYSVPWPGQMESDERKLVGRKTIKQSLAGGSATLVIEIGAVAPIRPRERCSYIVHGIAADQKMFTAILNHHRHMAGCMTISFDIAEVRCECVASLAALKLSFQSLEDASASKRHALERIGHAIHSRRIDPELPLGGRDHIACFRKPQFVEIVDRAPQMVGMGVGENDLGNAF